MDEPLDIKSLSPDEVVGWAEGIGEPAFRGRQLLKWLYEKAEADVAAMSDLSIAFRERLKESARIDELSLEGEMDDPDGTKKFIFSLKDGLKIEAVAIPEESRLTLCVSSQAGCAMACGFCLTGKMGLKRNLTSGEIVDQVVLAKRALRGKRKITNIVFMGMGEPLLNLKEVLRALEVLTHPLGLGFSPARITVSTCGITDKMGELGRASGVALAVSLNAADDDTRSRVMPVNKKYPIRGLVEAMRAYPLKKRGRITVEYVLIRGLNDSVEHARRLAGLLKGLRVKVNLIPLNEHPDIPFRRPHEDAVEKFREVLMNSHLTAITRQSRGAEIGAACGLLRPEEREVA